jgi:hypothetical protein
MSLELTVNGVAVVSDRGSLFSGPCATRRNPAFTNLTFTGAARLKALADPLALGLENQYATIDNFTGPFEHQRRQAKA